jgi:hypothetical protein
MRPAYDHDYPPVEWTAEGIADALADPDPFELPTYEDAAVFEGSRAAETTGSAVADLLDRAATAREEPVPTLSASLYLDYYRTGGRSDYQPPNRTRRRRLSRVALAECFEREWTYLDPVLDYVWAICEQSSWVIPAHLGGAQHRRDCRGSSTMPSGPSRSGPPRPPSSSWRSITCSATDSTRHCASGSATRSTAGCSRLRGPRRPRLDAATLQRLQRRP